MNQTQSDAAPTASQRNRMDGLCQELRQSGFVHVLAGRHPYVLQHADLHAGFASHWEDMPVDQYMRDGGTYRRRRFGCFTLDVESGTLAEEAHRPFIQTAMVNSFAGGIERHFEPLTSAVCHHALFRELVHWFGGLLPRHDGVCLWDVDVHAIRITATKDQIGNPAPEGIHRDGHDFVAQVFIRRSASAAGAESGVYDQDGTCLLRHTLQQPLEAVFVDDSRVLHGASRLHTGPKGQTVTRDMLFLNYNARKK